jgi:site-specific DNA-methyltransferase (adenine-specific)
MKQQAHLEIEMVSVDELKPYEGNAKIHDNRNVGQIASSIEEFNFADPIAAWHNDKGESVIIEGHGRLLAAQRLGIKELPVIYLDYLTDEQRRAYTIVHNSTTMSTGFDMDALAVELEGLEVDFDMTMFDFDVTFPEDEEADLEPIEADEDELPEISPTRVKMGQIWALGDHRLVCGDSTDPRVVSALMGDETADLLLTDPPYNVDYSEKNDHLVSVGRGAEHEAIDNDSFATNDEYQKFLTDAVSTSMEHIRNGGAFYIWYAAWFTRETFNACKDAGLQVRQCLYWVKNRIVLGRQDYQWQTEPCIYGWKDGTHWFAPTRKEHNVIDDMADLRAMDKKQLIELVESIMLKNEETDVLRADKPMVSADHPTTKPVELFARLIRNSTRKGEIVLDVFAGSGTTAMACEQMGRKARMVELSEGYCDVILERWERFTGKSAELIGMVE